MLVAYNCPINCEEPPSGGPMGQSKCSDMLIRLSIYEDLKGPEHGSF